MAVTKSKKSVELIQLIHKRNKKWNYDWEETAGGNSDYGIALMNEMHDIVHINMQNNNSATVTLKKANGEVHVFEKFTKVTYVISNVNLIPKMFDWEETGAVYEGERLAHLLV